MARLGTGAIVRACLFTACVLALLVALACMLARALTASATLRSMDDRLRHLGAQWAKRRRNGTLASTSTIISPPGTIVLLTGELRFHDQEAAHAFRLRLANVSMLVCTWRRFAHVATLLAPAASLVVDEPQRSAIPHGAAHQFYLLQLAVRHFRPRLLAASTIARLRTDVQYVDGFGLPATPEGVVFMESDLAYAAAAATFVHAYGSVFDQMAARRYHNHREEGRAMPPNFDNVARSDASNADRRGWRTRWRWLDYPVAVYRPGVRYSPDDIVREARSHQRVLMAMRSHPRNVTVRRLTQVPPVARFCAESAFLHHTLEVAAVRPLTGVILAPREVRCPDSGARRRGCSGWL